MKRLLIRPLAALFSLTLALAFAAPLRADDPPTTTAPTDKANTQDAKTLQKEIQARVEKLNAALKQKDLPGVMRMYASDYKFKDIKGRTITYSKAEDDYRSLFAQAKTIDDATTRIEKVTLKKGKKNQVTAVGSSTFKATLTDSKGKTHSLSQDGSGLLNWKKTIEGWQITGGKATKQTVLYDGKPYSDAKKKTKTASAKRNTTRTKIRRVYVPVYRIPRAPRRIR